MTGIREYPANLLTRIGVNELLENPIDYLNLTDDQLSGLEWALQDALTDYERFVILEKYQKKRTWKEVGEECNVSEKCVRLRGQGAVKKMKNLFYLQYIYQGYEDRTKELTDQISEQEAIFRFEVLKESELEKLFDGPVECLNFEPRIINALHRNGILDVISLLLTVQWKNWWERKRGIGVELSDRIMKTLNETGLIPNGFSQLNIPDKRIPYLEWEWFSFANLVDGFRRGKLRRMNH